VKGIEHFSKLLKALRGRLAGLFVVFLTDLQTKTALQERLQTALAELLKPDASEPHNGLPVSFIELIEAYKPQESV
jgi:hypothetical protein